MNSEYKKYSLDNLKTWIQDSLSSGGATPKEIYDSICEAVDEEYYIYKHHTSQCYELLALLRGNGNEILNQVKAHGELWDKEDIDAILGEREYCGEQKLTCDKDDKSPECQQAWNDFWEENYYPEEYKKYSEKVIDDCMPPWGHSDMEALRYTEEEMNAMCEKAESDYEKQKCREYNLREAEYYNKRAELDLNSGPHKSYIGWENMSESKFNQLFPNPEISRNDSTRLKHEDGWIYESPDGGKTVTKRKVGSTEKILVREEKVNKWILPVQQSIIDGTDEYYVNFPDDLLEAANLKEGDEIEWVDQKDGSYLLKKVFKLISMDEC